MELQALARVDREIPPPTTGETTPEFFTCGCCAQPAQMCMCIASMPWGYLSARELGKYSIWYRHSRSIQCTGERWVAEDTRQIVVPSCVSYVYVGSGLCTKPKVEKDKRCGPTRTPRELPLPAIVQERSCAAAHVGSHPLFFFSFFERARERKRTCVNGCEQREHG